MIDQKAREIEQTASLMPYTGRRGIGFEAARLGIIEGLEMAAKVADAYEYGKGRPLSEGDIIPMEGAEQAASEIAVVIRARIEEAKV